MRRLAALAVATAILAGAQASAQTIVAPTTVTTTPQGNANSFTIGFSDCCMGNNFTETLTFKTATSGLLSVFGGTSTNVNNDANDVDFSGITLSGTGLSSTSIPFTFNNDLIEQFARSGIAVGAGTYTLAFSGMTRGTNGSFGGNVSFVSNVPEASTWAMMLVGFGSVGFAMRRRRKLAAPRAVTC